jgi:hypothetical protein
MALERPHNTADTLTTRNATSRQRKESYHTLTTLVHILVVELPIICNGLCEHHQSNHHPTRNSLLTRKANSAYSTEMEPVGLHHPTGSSPGCNQKIQLKFKARLRLPRSRCIFSCNSVMA